MMDSSRPLLYPVSDSFSAFYMVRDALHNHIECDEVVPPPQAQ